MILTVTLFVLAQAPALDVPRARELSLSPSLRDDRNPFGEFREREASPEQLRATGGWMMAGGGALVLGGAGTWAFAKWTENRLKRGDASITSAAQLDAAVRRGKVLEAAAWTAGGLGVIGIGVGYAIFQQGRIAEPGFQLAVGPGYAAVQGVFR